MNNTTRLPAPDTTENESRAKALYDACPTVKPVWEQLGDVTRSVWRERVSKQEQASGATAPAAPLTSQNTLF